MHVTPSMLYYKYSNNISNKKYMEYEEQKMDNLIEAGIQQMNEIADCSICGEEFERRTDRPEGRLISCPAHSFGEVRPEDYERPRLVIDESEQEKLQRHGEKDEPEQVDNGQQHYEDMQSQYE